MIYTMCMALSIIHSNITIVDPIYKRLLVDMHDNRAILELYMQCVWHGLALSVIHSIFKYKNNSTHNLQTTLVWHAWQWNVIEILPRTPLSGYVIINHYLFINKTMKITYVIKWLIHKNGLHTM
jgi:hypothetical protein